MGIKILENDIGRPEIKNIDNNFEKVIASEPVQYKPLSQPAQATASLQTEIEALEKTIASKEKELNGTISVKHKALLSEKSTAEGIDKLHSQEKALQGELTAMSSELQNKKQQLNWLLQDKENLMLAQIAIVKYLLDAQERAEVGQAIINSLIKVINTVTEAALPVKNFTALQEKTYSLKFPFIKDMRVWGLTNIQTENGETIGIENIQNDTSLIMRETKDKLRLKLFELDKAQNILDAIRWDVLRAISFENFNRMERPEGLPNY